MRFAIVGAGAVGGVIGGRLFESGHDVVLVARGRHLEAIRKDGLTLASPTGSVVLPVPAVGHPAEAGFGPGDVAIIATKSQDTAAALDGIASSGSTGFAIACAQNGVRNEEAALRRFPDVYGICVMAPTAHTDAGVVEAYSAPVSGMLDIGRYPSGTDETCEAIAEALANSTFESIPRPGIMRWKYRKLLMNLYNALEALLGPGGWPEQITQAIKDEGEKVLAAAGIDAATEQEDQERRGDLLSLARVRDRRRGGGSSWQSLARGLGSIETDYLNGEIVLLGRLYGIPTPANSLVQGLADQAARQKASPGSISAEDLLALLG
jgi:2-dehydropantoate 2-reductase